MSHMFGYIGPGGGVTIGALVVILIGGIVVSAVGFILWLRIKRFLRGEGKGKWGVKVALQVVVLPDCFIDIHRDRIKQGSDKRKTPAWQRTGIFITNQLNFKAYWIGAPVAERNAIPASGVCCH